MIPNGAFEQEGFAGDGGASLRLGQRERYEELFAFADECSRLTMKVAALLPDATTKRQLVVSLFFARCTSHYQAAMNLAEGGMTVESLVLSRGLVETFFVLAAIAEDAVTPGELVGHDNASRVKHANALLKLKQVSERCAAQRNTNGVRYSERWALSD
ncbi:DUF5677 domain-containing protein [Cupriavidus sp. D39]|uniref:DUF5677 domain-containing protein n=1 Tax=Cupriavidus sp. D39 TaxID=2997877 RepID=UPI00226E71AB|nr:DUF5677 domain-containing protein [Cupriavidus sp. D39]MCY0853099.1 DUF5677 domain-containing protein [Cupriavidus sp. D39]